MEQCTHKDFEHGIDPRLLPCRTGIVAGLERVETTLTAWQQDESLTTERKVVFDVQTHDPSTWGLRCTDSRGDRFVITSITEQCWDGATSAYQAKGRKLRKDGKGFRTSYSEYLGHIGVSFFGETL